MTAASDEGHVKHLQGMKMAKRINSGFAEHIGLRIRARRLQLRMSQEGLAAALGLTFQQVQKYEKGTNSVRSDRLIAVAKALQVTPEYFFDGIVEQSGGLRPVSDLATQFMATPHAAEFVAVIARMTTEQRRALLDLINAMAPTEQAKAA